MRCSKQIRFKSMGKQYEGQCPDEAVWIDNTNLKKKGGRPLCNDHYQQWLKKVNSRYTRIVIKGHRI